MRSTIALLSPLLTTISLANPLHPRSATTYHGLAIDINTAPGMSPANWTGPNLVPIATLTVFPNAPVSASALRIDNETASNLVLADVECRAYRDTEGVQPGSAPFTLQQEALLSTNLGSVSSVLCYVTESD